jgi:hypothetical protein
MFLTFNLPERLVTSIQIEGHTCSILLVTENTTLTLIGLLCLQQDNAALPYDLFFICVSLHFNQNALLV